MRLETERLFLRTLKTEDIEALARLWTDPDVTRFMGGPRKYEEIYRALLEDAQQAPPVELNLWPLIEKSTNRIVGHCGVIDKKVDGNEEFEIVYVLAREAWGKGYATEIAAALVEYAHTTLGMQRIIALIDPQNPGSARVAAKVGLRFEKITLRSGGTTMQVFTRDFPARPVE